MTFTERIYDVFGDESIGWEAAKAIGEIVSPDTILTKANHAEIKVRRMHPSMSPAEYFHRFFSCKNTWALSFRKLLLLRKTAMVSYLVLSLLNDTNPRY